MSAKFTAVTLAFALAAGLGSAAFSQSPAPAPKAEVPAAKAKFSIGASSLIDLMRNAQTKPILQKYMGDLFGQVESNIDQIPAGFTLEALAGYTEVLTSEKLKAIDAELAKL